MSRSAFRNCECLSDRRSIARAPLKSTQSGSLESALCMAWRRAVVRLQSKSPAAESHTNSPSVSTMSSMAGERCSHHHCTSCCTHRDWVDSGDASRTKYGKEGLTKAIMASTVTAGAIVQSRAFQPTRPRLRGVRIQRRVGDRPSTKGVQLFRVPIAVPVLYLDPGF
jgi:hypothetical protein